MQTVIPTKAFIFAAGLGTRMRPLTDNTPKPLIKVGDMALLDYSLDMVIAAGVKSIGINTFYLPEQVEGHVQKYLERGVDIKIFRESERLETGGGLMNAMGFIQHEPIFTLNSDVIFKYGKNPLARLAANWNAEKHDLLMLLTSRENAVGYEGNGNFDVDGQGFAIKDGDTPYIYTGLQILNSAVLKEFEDKKIFSLSEVFNLLSERRRISALIHDGKWLHVGDMSGLAAAEKEL